MIRLIKAVYERAVSSMEVERSRAAAEARIISEASNIVVDRPDRDGWHRLFSVNDREKGLSQSDQLEMIRKARQFYATDPNGRAALGTMVHYIMGRGLTITPKSKDPEVWYIWQEFWTSPRNRMALRQFEIPLRSLRDGELFMEFFDQDEQGNKTGKTTIRFIDPLMVRAEDSKLAPISQTLNNGVNTDPEDVEKVLSYTVRKRENENEFRQVSAENVVHIKLNVDSDQKRGETQLLPIMKLIKHYDQWLENRIILNKIRSAIVLVRKVEAATPSELSSLAATLPAASTPATESRKKNIRGGTILTAGPGVSYEMLSPNLNAADAKEDGRNIKTSMAAGMNLPEYVFGDASNANYASSLIAESPMVKAIQYWQIFFEHWFSAIYRKVIQSAVDAGVLAAPNDDEFISRLRKIRDIKEQDEEGEPSRRQQAIAELMPEGRLESPSEIFFGCDMSWPEIVHRDLKGHIEALSIARQNGWVADPTASSAIGFDYDEEVRKQRMIEAEASRTGNPLLGKSEGDIGDDFEMDAEMEDILSGLGPEERDAVLKARDPREVVRIMTKRKAAAAAAGRED